MQIPRRYTKADASPYDGIAFCARIRSDSADDGGVSGFDILAAPFPDTDDDALITAPADWSDEAVRAFAARCMATAGAPAATEPVPDDDAPECLWRRRPAPDAAFGPETDARQVFNRVAGALARQGWQAGYFDSAADAAAFFDELRAMMCRGIAVPDPGVLRDAGRWWAGHDGAEAPSGFVTDFLSGAVRRAAPGDVAASGPALHGVTGDLAGEGGVMDLWRREAQGLAAGLGAGVNVSAIGGAASGADLLAQLAIGDSAAQAYARADGSSRFLTLDAHHPESARFAEAAAIACEREAAQRAGARLAMRHLDAIAAAACPPGGARRTDPAANSALRFALIAAREAMVPWDTVERLLALIADGHDREALHDFASLSETTPAAATETRRAVRIDDAMLDAAARPGAACALVETVARSAWHTGGTGLVYADTAEGWNPCPAGGAVRGAAADGGHVFLDDTACGRAHLNLEAFAVSGRGLDGDATAHVARLWTVALDIAIGITAQPTPRLAQRAWDYRPIGLAPVNIAGALMSAGIAYGSTRGCALAAAATATITAAAAACSAEMADEMGAFPAFAANRDAMLRVLRNHARAASGFDGGYEALGWPPVALHAPFAQGPRKARRLALRWTGAVAAASRSGMRNAQLSQVAHDRAAAQILDAGAPGAEPLPALAAFEALPGGGFRRAPDPRIVSALGVLGYGVRDIEDVLGYVAGFGTLKDAPGVNHDALRRCGFGEAALQTVEAALGGTFDIRFVFSRWTLGDGFCAGVLGLDRAAMEADGFDLLNALGFSDEAVRAANAWCFGAGTLDGAPHLRADHLAVFDTVAPTGEPRGAAPRGISTEARIHMLAALQPFVSGGVAHALTMPEGSTPDDCRDALMLGWRLGLKHLVLGRAPDAPATAFDGGWAKADALFGALSRRRDYAGAAGRRALSVIDGGRAEAQPRESGHTATGAGAMSQALALAHTARGVAPDRDSARKGNATRMGAKAASGAAGGAEAQRRQASEPPRSGGSVSSSADAPVEQRQV